MAKRIDQSVVDLIAESGVEAKEEITSFLENLLGQEDDFLKEVGNLTVDSLRAFAEGRIDKEALNHTLGNIKRLLDSHAKSVSARSKDKFAKVAKAFGLKIIKGLLEKLI